MSHKIDLGAVSPYAIAVERGFEGTIDEWLDSLGGPQGEQGPIGPEGPQGEKGDTIIGAEIISI